MNRVSAEAMPKPDLSVPLLVLVISIFLLEVQFGNFSFNPGNLLLFAGSAIAVLMASTRLQRAGVEGVSVRGFDWIYLVYLIYAAASAYWAPASASTFVGIFYLAAFWIATVFLVRVDLLLAVRYTVLLSILVAVLSFMAIAVSPSYAFQPVAHGDFPELRGILNHQLRLGLLMAIALGFLFIAYLNGDFGRVLKRWHGLAILVLLVCMVAAYARLYTVAAMVAVMLTVSLSKAGWVRVTTLIVGGFAAILIYAGQDAIFEVLDGGDVDLTLTGRTLVWERTSAHIENSPWIGFGYASFDHSSFDWLFANYRPPHPHNSFLQAHFETGLIGLVLTLLLVFSHFGAGLRVSGTTGKYSYSLFLVILTVLGSLTGSNYAGKPTLLFSLMLLFLAIETRTYHLAYADTSNRRTEDTPVRRFRGSPV